MPLSTIQPITLLSHRNMITNGDFMIWQRNAVATQTGSGGEKPIDGWRQGQSNVGQLSTQTERFTDAPVNTGLKHCLKMTVKTPENDLGANEDSTLITKIEGFNCQKLMYGTTNAKNTVLSFWVKSSIAGTFSVRIYQEDGNNAIAKPYTINSVDTWEYKTLSFPGNTLATIINDATCGLQISWYISAGANNVGGSNGDVWHSNTANLSAFGHTENSHVTTDESTFQLTGVQFEMGHVATPFEFKSFEENLAKCQRYYFQIGPYTSGSHGYGKLGTFATADSTSGFTLIHFPVEMRAKPTLVTTGTASHYSLYIRNIHIQSNTVPAGSEGDTLKQALVYTEHGTSLVAGQAGHLTTNNNNTSAFLGFDAEL